MRAIANKQLMIIKAVLKGWTVGEPEKKRIELSYLTISPSSSPLPPCPLIFLVKRLSTLSSSEVRAKAECKGL